MTTVNTDAKFNGLGGFGYTGAQEDRELKFYQANGATSNNLPDAELQFLTLQGYPTGTSEDRWFAYLTSLGYKGSVDDMIKPWWSVGPGVGYLFTGGAPGVWYDPSDLTTLFQDSAGTTPVTAVEQPVGRMLDKSGYGNHAFQATSASRPVLSARYNLLTKTEQFALPASAWGVPSNVTVTDNAVAGPNGTLTISQFVKASTGDCVYRQGPSVVAGSVYSYTGVFYVQKDNDETRFPEFAVFASGTGGDEGKFWQLNTKTGATIIRASLGTPTTNTITVTSSGNFWVVTILLVTALTTQNKVEAIFRPVSGNVWGTYNASASGTIYAGWFGLLPANQSTLPYQRVNTATDYATTGFLPYLKFDGVDDSLSTNSISFTSTDKMSVFAGVRKLSDSPNYQVITELSVNAGSNNGAFLLTGADSFTPSKYLFASKGTAALSLASTNSLSFSTPITNTLTGLSDISGDLVTLQVNGVQVAQSTADQGTGNFGNYPLYLGRRGGTLFPLNGQLYSMVIVGKAVTASELTNTENFVNRKTGAY